MAFSAALAERIRQALARKRGVEEKKMFGGVGFLLNGDHRLADPEPLEAMLEACEARAE